MSITLLPGKHTDAVSIDATTTCEPGNVDDLADLMFPDGLSDYTEPESEHPSAEPFFGMSDLSPTPGPRPDPITYPSPTATPSP